VINERHDLTAGDILVQAAIDDIMLGHRRVKPSCAQAVHADDLLTHSLAELFWPDNQGPADASQSNAEKLLMPDQGHSTPQTTPVKSQPVRCGTPKKKPPASTPTKKQGWRRGALPSKSTRSACRHTNANYEMRDTYHIISFHLDGIDVIAHDLFCSAGHRNAGRPAKLGAEQIPAAFDLIAAMDPDQLDASLMRDVAFFMDRHMA
jgi:hypothetical protein